MDDLFDIFGLSIYASGGRWCRLKNMPCIPLPSCEEYEIEEGLEKRCKYWADEDEVLKDNEIKNEDFIFKKV